MAELTPQQIRTLNAPALPIAPDTAILEAQQTERTAGTQSTGVSVSEIIATGGRMVETAVAYETEYADSVVNATASDIAITIGDDMRIGSRKLIRRTADYDGDAVSILPPDDCDFEGLSSLSLYGQYSYVELERISGTVFAIKALDDNYTITPTISFGGASTGITYLYNTGDIRVVKGRAYVNLRVTLSSKGTATGAVAIALMDAPPHKPSGVNRVTASVYMYNVTYAGQYGAYMSAGSSLITVGATAESGTQAVLTDANFTNTSTLMMAIEYPI